MQQIVYIFEKGYYENLIKLLSGEIKPNEYHSNMQSLIADLNRNLIEWFKEQNIQELDY